MTFAFETVGLGVFQGAAPGLLLAASNAALVTFIVYSLAVFGLAWLSNRIFAGKSFLSEYFLGSRSLGVWAFALTFAATSASGGSFTGFPSKIYSHGWVLALWIASYMVVPICAMGLLGKRLNQVARKSGAITVPDVFRDRFESPAFGLLAVLLIVFFMAFNLTGQFKAGSVILQMLLEDVPLFQSMSASCHDLVTTLPGMTDVDGGYLICLLAFGAAVILYTTYGGFHAVVWTDVMQGVVMVFGVLILLPLTLYLVGGLGNATRAMAAMRPPRMGAAVIEPTDVDRLRAGDWVLNFQPASADPAAMDEAVHGRLFRVTKAAVQDERGRWSVDVLEIMTEGDRRTVLNRPDETIHRDITWSPSVKPYAYGDQQPGVYVSGPGPDAKSLSGFLPLSLAFSFFIMWAISGAGQPSSMVRLMAFRNSNTLRSAIITVSIYYSLIYFPLVIIFCCSRVLLPGMDAQPDRIMPAMAVFTTQQVGVGWLAGLLVAAPFAAVMSTVDSFLLMISSALVRDVYQRNINPEASEKTIRRLSHASTLAVGVLAMAGAINPPKFLQDIVVYTGSGLAACFLAPMVFALYWPRANLTGCLAAMIAGFAAHTAMFVAGIFVHDSFFDPLLIANLDPIAIGLAASFVVGWIATKATAPPDESLVKKYFFSS